jgi:hypothetical protein
MRQIIPYFLFVPQRVRLSNEHARNYVNGGNLAETHAENYMRLRMSRRAA